MVLAGQSDRLRVIATAMRGLAGDMGGSSVKSEVPAQVGATRKVPLTDTDGVPSA